MLTDCLDVLDASLSIFVVIQGRAIAAVAVICVIFVWDSFPCLFYRSHLLLGRDEDRPSDDRSILWDQLNKPLDLDGVGPIEEKAMEIDSRVGQRDVVQEAEDLISSLGSASADDDFD